MDDAVLTKILVHGGLPASSGGTFTMAMLKSFKALVSLFCLLAVVLNLGEFNVELSSWQSLDT